MVSKNNPLRDKRHPEKYFPFVDFIRRPTSTDIRHPNTGVIYSRPYFWRVRNKPDGTAPDSGVEGELWYLVDITGNVANWIIIGGASTQPIDSIGVDFNTAPGTNPVLPDINGLVTLNGNVVANGTNANSPVASHSRSANAFDIDLQVAAAVSATPADTNDVGLASFNDAHFTVDANGFVSLIGGGAAIDTVTGDDATAVSPDASGNLNLIGETVANATNVKPLYIDGDAGTNTLNAQIQVAAAVTGAPGDNLDAGLSSYDDVLFQVNADGYVETATTTDGDLIIGNTARGTGKIGNLTSPDSSITITYNDPDIELITNSVNLVDTTVNLGFTYSSNTFTITAADGTNLNTSNGYVRIASTTSGLNKVYTINQNFRLIDSGGSSTIIGNLFGKLSGDNWNKDMPFFVYAVNKSSNDDVWFAISRVSGLKVSPQTAWSGNGASATADNQQAFFYLQRFNGATWDENTLADYGGQPCVPVGCFRMQGTAGDDWTVQTLGNQDGVGLNFETAGFGIPTTGVFGFPANQAFSSSAGTPISYATGLDNYGYSVLPNGKVFVDFKGSNQSNGSGAGLATFILPFRYPGGGIEQLGNGYIYGPTFGTAILDVYGNTSPANSSVLIMNKSGSTFRALNTSFSTDTAAGNGIKLFYSIDLSTA